MYKETEITFVPNMQMTSMYMRKFLASLIIEELQLNITVR